MIARYWSALLVVAMVVFLVTLPTGCATQQEPTAQEQPAAEPAAESAPVATIGENEPIYTADDPGAWEGKESSHIPVIAYEKTATGLRVTVTVNHVMDASIPHYIEWVKLMDGAGRVYGDAFFEAADANAEATFELETVPAKLVAIERCNMHGLWKEEVDVS